MAKILLVEDDKSLREIYGVRLKAEGYEIVSAGDGEDALALAIKERPDLIVSDVMMPKISGFDMLDILRSTTETRDIKVIMMTALSSEDQRARGEQLGANKYLVKSQVGIEDVVRAVHEVMGDAPVAPEANAFATPGPTAAQPAPQPVTPAPVPAPAPVAPAAMPAAPTTPASAPQAPQQPVVPAPAPVAPAPTPPAAPTAPAPAPAATTSVQSAMTEPPASQPAAPAAPGAPEPFSLPQPTAPFSTDRPAGLADRIIQPLEKPAEPDTEPIADKMNKELSDDPSASPFAAGGPAPSADMSTSDPVPDSSGLNFEETPRAGGATPTPPQAPAV